VDQFEKMIPVELAAPPWNYTRALQKGIQVQLLRNVIASGTTTRRRFV